MLGTGLKRRDVQVVVVVLALVATLVLPTNRPAVADDSPPESYVDLTNPENGISDPTEHVPVLGRDCTEGQIDVNTASSADIAEAFDLASKPTVTRIVEMRPWLTAADLTSVPGVGMSKADLVAGACATPLEIPEPFPMACEDDDQIDLQVASAAEIASGLGLPKKTASEIVEHRPVPQDLYQIAAPRTPGLGEGRIRKLLESGRVCVTPVPTTFEGADYRFVYPEHGAVIRSTADNRYALIVPPGASSTQTFGSVTPILGEDLPTADFHLFGPISGQVAVRLPDNGFGAPIVFHDASDGTRISTGDGAVAEPTETVVAALNSLSTASSGSIDTECIQGLNLSVFCPEKTLIDELLTDVIVEDGRQFAETMNEIDRRFPGAAGECHEAFDLLVSDGSVPRGIICSAEMRSGGAESAWTFENIFSSEWLIFENKGTPYFVDRSGGAPARAVETSSPGTTNNGTYSGPVARRLADFGLVLAGHARSFVKHEGDGATTVTVTGANPGVLAVSYAAMNITESVDGVADLLGAGTEFQSALVNCVGILEHNSPSPGIAKTLLGCMNSAAQLAITNELDGLDGRTREARRLKNKLGLLKKVALAPAIAEFGAAFATNILDGSSFNEQSLSFRHLLPLPPPPGSGGSSGTPVPGTDGGIDGSLPSGQITDAVIKLENDLYHAEFTSGGDKVGHAILDVDTYACLTRRYLVRDWLPQEDYLLHINQNSAFEATCDDSVPEFSAPPGSRNFILRKLDGTSYLLGADGKVRPIQDGSTYVCLAQRVFVLDARSDAEILSYPQAPIPEIATCD